MASCIVSLLSSTGPPECVRALSGAPQRVSLYTDAHPSAPRPDKTHSSSYHWYQLHTNTLPDRTTVQRVIPGHDTVRQYSVVTSFLVLVPRETRDRCAVSLTERGVLTSCYTYSCRIRVRVTKVSICIYPISISASLSLLTHIHTDTRSPTRATATSLPLKCTRTHTCRSMPRPGPDGIAVSSVRRTIDPFPACVS